MLAQTSPDPTCDSFNYIQTATGECVDLSYLTKMPVEPLDQQFYQQWAEIGVKVIRKDCSDPDSPSPTLSSPPLTYGLYYPDLNLLQLCENQTKANPKQTLDTIVHESWHIVQDCQAGFQGNSGNIIPIVSGNSPVRALVQALGQTSITGMLSQLSPGDLADLQTLYAPEDLGVEIEARFLQNYPETVLEALERCPRSG